MKTELRFDADDCLLKDLKAPDGVRLLGLEECMEIQKTDEQLRNLLIYGWVWVSTPLGIRAVGFDDDDVRFRVVGLDGSGNWRSRGVFIKKEVRE